jgi:7-cyano-7-deazaguanine synthase
MTHVDPKAVILLSGGLDSTVTAAIAKQDGYRLYCLTISYGQRHHVEVERARAVAQALSAAAHVVVDVDLRAFGGSALTDDVTVPKDRTQEDRAGGIPVTYVPARNTIFLSLALAYAETLEAQRIYFGAMCWTIPVIRTAAPILSTRLKRSPGLEPRWGSRGGLSKCVRRS